MNTKIMYTGLFFIFLIISGYLTSGSGTPYRTLIFTIHKFVGVGLGVFLIMNVIQIQKTAPLSPLGITVLVVTILIFVALVAAGGLLSVQAEGGLRGVNPAVLTGITWVHKIFPYLAVLSTAGTLYLLLYNNY